MKNKMLSIMLVVSVVCLAMTATTFGVEIYDGTTTISTAVNIDPNEAYIGDTADADFTVTSSGSFTCTGGRIGGNASATVNVAFNGSLAMNGETEFNEAENATTSTNLNVYGTAYIEQLKMYGWGVECKTVVGNTTDAATLTIVEGLLGKYGDATITIAANGTMIITGDLAGLPTWTDFYKIDGNNAGTNSYIDLVGGTLKVADHADTAGYESNIIAYGGTGTVFSEVIDANNVYTAEHGKITAGSLANQWLTDAGGPVEVAMTAEVRNFVDGNGRDNHSYTYSVISGPGGHTASFAATVKTNETATEVDLSANVTFNEIGDYTLEVKVDDTVTLLTYSDTIDVHVYENRCAAVKADLPYGEAEAQEIGDTNYDCEVNLVDFAAIASNWLDDVSD